MGSACARWGWSTNWCYVESDYEGVGREFVRASPTYKGKFFAQCGKKKLGAAGGNSTNATAATKFAKAAVNADKATDSATTVPDAAPGPGKTAAAGPPGVTVPTKG